MLEKGRKLRRMASSLVIALLFVSLFVLAFTAQPAKAQSGQIIINPDGSISSPVPANITNHDNITYTFNGNNYLPIVVERNNIIINGEGYTLQAPGSNGFSLLGVNDITIKNTTITNSYDGIFLHFSSGNVLSGNNITGNSWEGVWLDHSDSNDLSDNNLTANRWYGIVLYDSDRNALSHNNLTANSKFSIWLSLSSNNVLSGNNATATNGCGVRLDSSSFNVLSGNSFDDNSYEGILADYSDNNTLIGNDVTANSLGGICLYYSCDNNTLSGNNITENGYSGILLGGSSSDNILSGNNITSNSGCGIRLESSSGNTFQHNNLDNAQQVYDYSWDHSGYPASINMWDNGYPSGGNYWSDYSGEDCYSGQHQDRLGSDGIGDTPYWIDASNGDHYPFMQPSGWENHPISIESNATVYVTDKAYGTATLNFTVSGPSGKIGYINATMPVGVNNTAIKVYVDLKLVQQPFPIITTNGTDYFIYFEFPLSTHEVAIQFGGHSVAVTSVVSSKTVVGQDYVSEVNVTVANTGSYAEPVNLTIYANTTAIAKQTVTLANGASTTITLTWNTTGFAYGNYTIGASVTLAPGETNGWTSPFTYGTVKVTVPGDVNGDGVVNILDVSVIAAYWLQTVPPAPSNADVNCDGVINILDVSVCAAHWLQTTSP